MVFLAFGAVSAALLDVFRDRERPQMPRFRAVHRYVSPGERELSPEEAEVRRVAYAIKAHAPREMDLAGAAMAALIEDAGSPLLIPIPSSTGSTEANAHLARAIARHRPGAQVVDVLRRRAPTPSAREQRALGRPLSVEAHGMFVERPVRGDVFFVDNVLAVGTTMEAAIRANGGVGEGLVWAHPIWRSILL